MITLIDVSRDIPGAHVPQILLNNVSLHINARDRVGILASPGAGKSSLARLLCRIEPPDSGHVIHRGLVSWPLGFAGFFHPDLTGVGNLELIARLNGRDADEVVAFCTEFSDLGALIRRKVKFFTNAQRAALSFAASMAILCDLYIADEVVGFGQGLTRDKSQAMLEKRLDSAGLVFLSKNAAQIKKLCSRYYVLTNGKLIACPDADIMQALMAATAAPAPASSPDADLLLTEPEWET